MEQEQRLRSEIEQRQENDPRLNEALIELASLLHDQGRDAEANPLLFRALCSRQSIEGGSKQVSADAVSPPPSQLPAKPRSARRAPFAEKYVPPGYRKPAAATKEPHASPAKEASPASNGMAHSTASQREPEAGPLVEQAASPAKPGGRPGKSSPREPRGSDGSLSQRAESAARRGEASGDSALRADPGASPQATRSQEARPNTQERAARESTGALALSVRDLEASLVESAGAALTPAASSRDGWGSAGQGDSATGRKTPSRTEKVPWIAGGSACKRPDRQVFEPRAQLEARKKAEQQKEELRKEEEALAQAKLQREKEARAQECRRQEALHRSTTSDSPYRPRAAREGEDNPTWGDRDAARWRPRTLQDEADEREGKKDDKVWTIPHDGAYLLEILGLEATDKVRDVEAYLSGIRAFKIPPVVRWADNTHAVAVFSDVMAAKLALRGSQTGTLKDHRMQLRPWEEASRTSKKISAKELQPAVPRPKTTNVVAKRLLGHALANNNLRDLDGERALKEQRGERRAQKEERQNKLAEVWGSDEEE